MPAPSTAEPSPRGVKRSRTPDHSGNGLADGDQDDGTCAIKGGRRGTDSGHPYAFSSVSSWRLPYVFFASLAPSFLPIAPALCFVSCSWLTSFKLDCRGPRSSQTRSSTQNPPGQFQRPSSRYPCSNASNANPASSSSGCRVPAACITS